MTLQQAFAIHGGKMNADQLRSFRFDPVALIDAGRIAMIPNTKVFKLTSRGGTDNPASNDFDFRVVAVP